MELAAAEGLDLASSTAYSDSHSDIAVPRSGRPPGRRQSGSRAPTGRRASEAGRCCASGRRRSPVDDERTRPRERLASARVRAGRRSTTLVAHFEDAERRGKRGHGLLAGRLARDARVDPAGATGARRVAEEGFERWDGSGRARLPRARRDRARDARRPAGARTSRRRASAASRPASLGYWVRRLAEGGLVAALTATSPRRLPHPEGGPPLTGTNPLAIAIPSSDGDPIVADVSMGAVTHGDVLAGRGAARGARPLRRRAGAQGVRARCRARAPRLRARRPGARRRARRRSTRARSRARASARPRRRAPAPRRGGLRAGRALAAALHARSRAGCRRRVVSCPRAPGGSRCRDAG